MNLFISGQKMFGASVLRQAIEDGHEVVGVSCPRLDGKGEKEDRLAAAAALYGVPVVTAGSLRRETLIGRPDVIVCAHSHDFIGRATRAACRFGAIGYHPSLLPRHRGRDAIRWAVKMNDPITGGTVYSLDGVMDGGPILAQDWCWIRPGDTAATLWRESLFPLGLRLLRETLAALPDRWALRRKQDESVATFEPACNPPRAFRPDLLCLPGPAGIEDGTPGYAWRARDGGD